MTIRDLMDIYRSDENPEYFFKYFSRFDNYIDSLKKKNRKEKKKIKEIANNYEKILKKKIEDQPHKKGPKPKFYNEYK